MSENSANETTHEEHGKDEHGHEDPAHGGSLKTYIAVFVALCVLTGASFFTCSEAWPFKSTPSIGWAFMMAVSCTKALLVILFFMHLLWEANWKYVLTIPASIMSVFMVFMLVPDVGMRWNRSSEERKLQMAEPAEDHEHSHSEPAQSH